MTTPTLLDLVNAKKRELTNTRNSHTRLRQGSKNVVRIFKNWDGHINAAMWQDFSLHYTRSPNDDKPQGVHICMMNTFGQPCPICDALALASRTATTDEERKAIEDSKATKRILFNALIIGEGNDDTPVILEVPPTVAGQIFDLMGTYHNLVDDEEGRNLIITATGSGLSTRYSVIPDMQPNPIKPHMLTKLTDLEEHAHQENSAAMAKALGTVNAITSVAADATYTTVSNVSNVGQLGNDFDDDVVFDDEDSVEKHRESIARNLTD